jgi:hypothetical protein
MPTAQSDPVHLLIWSLNCIPAPVDTSTLVEFLPLLTIFQNYFWLVNFSRALSFMRYCCTWYLCIRLNSHFAILYWQYISSDGFRGLLSAHHTFLVSIIVFMRIFKFIIPVWLEAFVIDLLNFLSKSQYSNAINSLSTFSTCLYW